MRASHDLFGFTFDWIRKRHDFVKANSACSVVKLIAFRHSSENHLNVKLGMTDFEMFPYCISNFKLVLKVTLI